MKKRFQKFVLTISTFIIFCITFSSYSFAQNRAYRGLIISPVNAILEVNRGDTLSGSIRFTNDLELDGAVNVKTSVQDFKLSSDYSINDTVKYPPASSLASWTTLNKSSISVKKGETVEVSYSIKIPLNADYGGHYATISFTKDKDTQDQPGQVALVTKLQFPMLVNVNGNRIEKLDIESFKTDQSSYESTAVNFVTKIKNIGNVHLSPYGTIKITGGLIGNGTELKFNPDFEKNSGYVLPDKDVARTYTNEWKDDGFRFGQYTATLIVNYDTLAGPASITSITQFWIIPWKLIGISDGVILLIIVIFVLVKKVKNRNRLKNKRQNKNY